MPFFAGAHDFSIKGGSFSDVSGNAVINDSSRRTSNYGSYNTTNRNYDNSKNDYSVRDYSTHKTRNFHEGTVNNFDNAKNVNTGDNHGTINQQDNRGANPSQLYDRYAQRGYDYLRGRGQGYRPPYRHPYSGPAAGPPYGHEEPQYFSRPEYQPPYPDPYRGFPPSNPQYRSGVPYPYGAPPQGSNAFPPGVHAMDAEHSEILREGMEELRMEGRFHSDSEGEDDDELNPRVERMKLDEPMPLSAGGFTPATDPRVRSDLTASAPPTIASTSASARSASPPPMKSNNPFNPLAFKDRS